ncbi:DUF4365 domain-containing protein [Paenibacillus sp. 276b]|uniref:DUF4365 domain-containing protein n=1 Tax=Paenibacillus sp. 276b TaxID=1566277 RepID=UPI000897E070|nr:DUF4365 domain-containing protein [Paenibacillus sp. 276b]SEB27556.1 protein of unknown function [Paenibacillus sp. 276b]
MDLPKFNGSTEHHGVNLVNTIVTSDFRWIFREQPTKDYGIDAHIEIVEDNRVTGRLIAVQIKTGPSYLTKRSDKGFIYNKGKMKHLNYWRNHSLPVILVLCDDTDNICYWVQVTEENTEVADGRWEICVPYTQNFNVSSMKKLARIGENLTDYERRLHTLVLARSWMDELARGNRVIFESKEWVNKTSGKGSIKLEIVDSITDETTLALDYPMVFLGLISYEQAFKKLFPWAHISVDDDFYLHFDEALYSEEEGVWDSEEQDYVFHGTSFDEWRNNLPEIRPYEVCSGEVACYRLVLTLNQTGEAFLMIDDYLKSGVVNSKPEEPSISSSYHGNDEDSEEEYHDWQAQEEDYLREREAEESERDWEAQVEYHDWQAQEEDYLREREAEESERDWEAQVEYHDWQAQEEDYLREREERR